MNSAPSAVVAMWLVLPLVLAASCAPSVVETAARVAPTSEASATPPAPDVALNEPAPSPPRAPPAVVTTPMKGEPGSDALKEARLVASSCESYEESEKKLAETRVKRMRAEVDDEYNRWAQEQPGCWEQYRWDAQAQNGGLWGVGTGVAYGAGGFGLSGVGAGGGGFGMGTGAAVMGSGAGRPVPKAASASGTNNQVVGVDEADLVKTDGRYVYLAVNGALRIVEAMNPRMVSVTKFSGTARDMFVEGDRAVVFASSAAGHPPCTYGYDCRFAGDGTSTKILIYDVSQRAEPRLVRQIDLSGSLMAARRIGTTVHTVVSDGDPETPAYATWPAGLETCGSTQAVVRAKFAALKVENERKIRANVAFPTISERGAKRSLCSGLMRTAFSDGQAFTSVVSFDLRADDKPAVTATIQSRPGAVFASARSLYLSVVHDKRNAGKNWYSFYPGVDEASEIHQFRIGSSPQDTRYVGSGVVPGHVLNQFSMDEWYGYLRIATTRGRVPDPKVESAVSILAEGATGNLVRVGAITGIAPGEDIRAVRFDDDRAYVVTFKKTDPLFVMDLYQPSQPRILGELKIPGFSTYIHRIDADHLLSIGFDANDHGSFAYFDGVILQLFDVRDPTDPKLIHKEKIGTRGSSSEAATHHLAFNYFADKGLLAIPMTVCEGGRDGVNGTSLTFSGLLVYNVSTAHGFKRLGGVNHGTVGANCATWWSNANSMVKRSVFLDDLVYSIAMDKAKVQKMGQLGDDIATLSLVP